MEHTFAKERRSAYSVPFVPYVANKLKTDRLRNSTNWLTSMCNNTALQQKIRKHTDNGDLIAQFLADTIRGEYPDAKYHHKLEAAKLLSRYESSDDNEPSQFWGLIPTPEELAEKQHGRKSPSP